MKPNFLMIGAARSGTTSLFLYMDAHPQIIISQVKELNFFSKDKFWSKGFTWYEKRFSSNKVNALAIGEGSTSYTQHPFTPDVAKRIFDYNPNMKLIYVVRDPIERFISHYLQRTKAGLETREFHQVIDDIDNVFYAWQGLYSLQLNEYLKYFPKEQLSVISFDDIKKDTHLIVKNLFTFLAVDQFELGEQTSKVHNAAGKVIRKNKFGLAVLKLYHDHIEQRNIPFIIKKTIYRIANIGGKAISKPVLDEKMRSQLEQFYLKDSQQLSEQFSIATSHWFQH